MLNLNVVKQVVTEVTGVNGDLFRVGKRFLESKGRIYLSYSVENEVGNIKSYKFGLEIKEGKLQFTNYYYHEDKFSKVIYEIHDKNESLIKEVNLCNKNKIDRKEGGFIKELNKKLNR